ncbi:MAG: TonB-dependent receptor [Halioglobus sp.]|nr:TonB-dependent receptor [Halioglobus sp.]MDG2326529.1 TonB-dependent receptor [Halioglobus sp.]
MTVSQPRLLTAAIATTVFVLNSPALSLAQEVRLPPDTELALEEIIVTAQKRSTSVQETPIAITAFTGEILANGVVTDAADLNGRVPNLHIAKAGSNVEIAIRGINSTNNVEAGDPAVAFHVDGIYLGRPIAAGAIFYDLERVEVLNGPQGTLYGRNATAGSINVITNKPEEEFSASLELNAGNYDRVYTQGMLNVPISEQFQMRAAFFTDDRDGYYDAVHFETGESLSEGDSADDQGFRLHGLYQPTENLSMLLSVDSLSKEGAPPYQRDVPTDAVFTVETTASGYSDIEDKGIKFELNWDLDFATLTYMAASRETEYSAGGAAAGQSALLGASLAVDNSMEQLTHELRLASSGGGALQWIGGAYYFKEEQDIFFILADLLEIFPAPLPKGDLTFDQPEVEATSTAVFGQIDYSFAENLRFSAGLRYNQDEKARTGRSIVGITEFDLILQEVPNIADEDWDSTDWKLGLDWFVTQDSMLYVSVGTGYKAGGYFDGIAPNDYDEETVLSWEVGSKNEFMDNRLQLNVAAFYYDYEDFQVTQTEPLAGLPGGAQGSVTRNAGAADIYGAELSTQYLATAYDHFSLQLSYLHSEFTDFELYDPINDVTNDWSGNELNKAPGWTATVGYRHEWNLGDKGSVAAGGLVYFVDDHYLTFRNEDVSEQEAYTKVDLNLMYTSPQGNWFVSAYGKNLTDEEVMVSLSNIGIATAGFAAPRTYGVRAGYSW